MSSWKALCGGAEGEEKNPKDMENSPEIILTGGHQTQDTKMFLEKEEEKYCREATHLY